MAQEYLLGEYLHNRNGALGINDRDLKRGLDSQHYRTGINSVSMDMRLKDAAYYENMPMIGFEKDPLNNEKEINQKNQILNSLKEQAKVANSTRNPLLPSQKQTTSSTNTTPIQTSTSKNLNSFWQDLQNWDKNQSIATNLERVFLSQNRLMYIIFALVLFTLIMIIAHALTF